MKYTFLDFWKRHNHKIALVFTIVGAVYYIGQSWDFAHTLSTIVWDEGMYLYKGYLFASGHYQPYEDYGPWTNHTPLAFLIPGYVQAWFGPGIRTGRYFAVALGFLSLLGLWIIFNRLGGRWLAGLGVWAVALNPSWVKAFSQTYAQGLVHFFFVWMLVLAVGKERRTWELTLAAALAALAGMTRINVLPALFIYIIYVLWQYGRKTGFTAAFAGILTVLIIHALYWPDILKLWAYWIPSDIAPFISEFRSPWREIFVPEDFSWLPVSAWINDKTHMIWNAIKYFGVGMRSSFLPAAGVIATLFLWPKRTEWKSEYRFRLSVFLIAEYVVLLFVHLWAALDGHTCRFSCFPGYVLFFNMFGLAAFAAAYSHLKRELPVWRQVLVMLSFLAIGVGLNPNWLITLLEFPLPRPKFSPFLPGEFKVWVFLTKNYHFDYFEFQQHYKENLGSIRWLNGILLVVLVSILVIWLLKRHNINRSRFGYLVISTGLVFGLFLSPNTSLGGRMPFDRCQEDLIASHEQVGFELNTVIPAGSLLYWDVKSNMLLLYLPEAEVFTPQLNSVFTKLLSAKNADLDLLYRFGWWNDELGEQWIEEADFIVIESRFFDDDWLSRFAAAELKFVFLSSPVEPCRGDDTRILVLEKYD